MPKEEELYQPVKTLLETVFRSYVEEGPYQRAPFPRKENLYLEITANKKRFSGILKREFDDETFRIFSVERSVPDIMGFVQKRPAKKHVWSASKKRELITVEVKTLPITFLNILQAKLYQDIFRSTFGLLISPKGIIEEKVRFVLDTKIGRKIRGKVIIAQVTEEPAAQYGHFTSLKINPKFKNSVPEPFKRFCKP
jgi:hypothetical protein